MGRRQLTIIFGVLALLIVIYAVGKLANPGASPPLGAGIDLGDAVDSTTSSIRVVGPAGSDSVHLEKHTGRWTVNGYPADSAQAGRLLRDLDTLQVRELVSRSPSNHARLGVADSTARTVTIGNLTLLLGRSQTGNYYVRLPDQNETYLLPGQAGQFLSDSVAAWRDRTIAQIDIASVNRVDIRRGRNEISLVRNDSVWKIGNVTADSLRVRDLLRQLARLSATGFPPESLAMETDFDHPTAVVDVYTDSVQAGPQVSLRLVSRGEPGTYLVRRVDEPTVFEVPEWAVKRLLPERAELLGEKAKSTRKGTGG